MAKVVVLEFVDEDSAIAWLDEAEKFAASEWGFRVVATAADMIGFGIYGPGVRRHSDDRGSGTAQLQDNA
jgi:hypothetical protein